jgi:hypothetical protein
MINVCMIHFTDKQIFCSVLQMEKSYDIKMVYLYHRVDTVLGFFSSRPNWDYPTPSPAGERAHCPLVHGGGGTHSLAEEGLGESKFRRGERH